MRHQGQPCDAAVGQRSRPRRPTRPRLGSAGRGPLLVLQEGHRTGQVDQQCPARPRPDTAPLIHSLHPALRQGCTDECQEEQKCRSSENEHQPRGRYRHRFTSSTLARHDAAASSTQGVCLLQQCVFQTGASTASVAERSALLPARLRTVLFRRTEMAGRSAAAHLFESIDSCAANASFLRPGASNRV